MFESDAKRNCEADTANAVFESNAARDPMENPKDPEKESKVPEMSGEDVLKDGGGDKGEDISKEDVKMWLESIARRWRAEIPVCETGSVLSSARGVGPDALPETNGSPGPVLSGKFCI